MGRYLRYERTSDGHVIYWWVGTTADPVPVPQMLRSITRAFGVDGVRLLAHLAPAIGLEDAAELIRRLLRGRSTSPTESDLMPPEPLMATEAIPEDALDEYRNSTGS